MKSYDATERAYKNGYAKGYADGKRETAPSALDRKVIDPAPIIKQLADRCLVSKGLACSILGDVIDLLRAAPDVREEK